MSSNRCVQALGELNGRWTFLFKFAMVLMPIIAAAQIGFGAWVVTTFKEFEHRVTVVETKIEVTPGTR